MKDFQKNVAEVKAATEKKPYMKPEIEFFDVEFEAPLLSASVDATATSKFRTINRQDW